MTQQKDVVSTSSTTETKPASKGKALEATLSLIHI